MTTSSSSWFYDLLVCLECGEVAIGAGNDVLCCRSCGAAYPVSNGVPLLLRHDTYHDSAELIGRHLGGISAEAVQSVFGTALRYRLSDTTLRTEFTNIVERYIDIMPTEEHASLVPCDASFELVAEYFNPRFVAGRTSYRSFRLRKISPGVWASTGSKPWNLSYHLHDLGDSDIVIEGVRSAFPIPLRPFHELTIPLRIVAPAEVGRYRIVVEVVQEFTGWIDEPVFEGEIEVLAEAEDRPILIDNPHEGFFDFEGDLRQCGQTIRRAVDALRTAGVTDQPHILEVACGNDPQVLRHYQPGTRVVACDLSFPQAQFGALQYDLLRSTMFQPDTYRFVAADVYHPPFRSEAFDLVVVSAALHHFTDVTDALVRLAGLLQPQGLLVLMREPCKVFPEDETFLKELANGFNEQQFELAEYDEMFKRANLVPVFEQIDYECSYKVILRKDLTK